MERTVDTIQAALLVLRDVFEPTPLQRNAMLSERYNADIWIKREDLTPVRSYKLRGALNAMRKQGGQDHFVCASAGNHAQGVAYMCQRLGRKGTIFMPVTTPQQKVQKTKIFGGEHISLRLVGDYFDDTLRAAQKYCQAQSAHFLSPFDDPDIIEGQATVGAEIYASLGGAPDHVISPVGGGGLAAGLYSFFQNEVSYTLVEPAGAACLAAAMEAGAPVKLSNVDTFADGAAVGQIGAAPFAILKALDRRNVLDIEEDRICTTMLEMLNIEGMVLEPAGALAIDALKDVGGKLRGKSVVVIASGGNFDFERLPEVKERAQRWAGLKKYLILRMPQRPGSLRDFLQFLGPDDDITRFEYLKKSTRNFGSVLIGIETSDETAFIRIFAQLDKAGFEYRDISNDALLSQFLV